MEKDLPEVLELVRDLAKFENAEESLTANIEDYKKGFRSGLFDAIVAESDNQIVGMALYYDTFSTWKGKMIYLEDFVVKPQVRGKGIGKQIYDTFIAMAKLENAKLCKWEVLDWNERAINFYNKQNVVFDKEWWNCKVYFE